MNPIGSTLQQRYQILEQLGQDGAVATYLAIDLQVPGNLQLKCAIHRYELPTANAESREWKQAISKAQSLYDLSRKVDRLPIIYSYFAQAQFFYIVREFVAGTSLAQELATVVNDDRQPNERSVWTQSQVVMFWADVLEVLRDIERCDVIPEQISIANIFRRQIDGKLVPLNLPLTIDSFNSQQPLGDNLRLVAQIAIAAASGNPLPLKASQIGQWQQLAPQIDRPELVAIVDRLLATAPAQGYPSIGAAWQAVVSVIPKLLVDRYSAAEQQTEIARHVRQLVDRGTELYEVGSCDAAIVAYDRALGLDPECVDAYCGRGNARRFVGDYPGSEADFELAICLDPDCGLAYIGRGLAVCFGEPSPLDPNADFELGKKLLASPTSAIEYVMRGTAKAQLNDPVPAIADYDLAIAMNPRLLLAYNNRGNLYQYLGDSERALADFSKVLEIDSRSAIAYNNRAIIYTQHGQFSAAVADYLRAIELQPDFVSAYNNLGNNYCQMAKYAEAIASYTKAIELDANFAVAYSNRANIYRVRDEIEPALADYNRAIELDPNLVIAHYNRGICYRQIGNHQAAIENYTQTIALDRQYFHAYYHRGNARKYLGDRHGAIADYTHTICFDPDHLHAHYNRAITRSEIGDLQGALDDLDRAIELDPAFSAAYYQRAWILASDGEHQYALAQYQQAIELNPDYLDAYYHRGCSYQSLGELSAASADFSRAIALDPNYAPAYYQRGKVSEAIGDRAGAISDYHQAANLYLDRGDSKTYQYILQLLDRSVNRN
ncbi:tetratricopeptide repeat protein [Chamaesiphon sp. VAR_69_metabat_338]|uniref:tetratricopeptide repeat protein n=1 Tax=Chamaesiphon sp. VAR_69_metabat_338 TaxID=2964704 RepID=UPI00286E0DBA|nr:tetratricopeptide repeat protein [Chamaesiphon sp. VAR_69_metabat_338]